jgi:hypothetical protein
MLTPIRRSVFQRTVHFVIQPSNFKPELSLALFEAWVFLVDYKQHAFSANDFAINAAFFNCCPYFHNLSIDALRR